MSTFAWRRRPTRHFGEEWVPFAEFHLRSALGRWHAFSLQVDTGAVISVLRQSAAALLGIDLDRGQPVELAGVAGQPQPYFVHRLQARLADRADFEMRIAFAAREDVPNVLGRLDILERFQIDLDVSLKETRFSPPWLDEKNRQLWNHVLAVEEAILSEWAEHRLPGRCDEAARRFLNRADQLIAAGAGLLKLHRGFEMPLITRSLFDLSVQFEYLTRDPEPRAQLYLDFEHITKHRLEQAWLKLPGSLGDRLRSSSKRVPGEAANKAAFERALPQYRSRPGSPSARSHWYPGTLRSIAAEVDRGAEYEAIYGLFSAWAHGDSWASTWLELGHGGLWHAFMYWARMLVLIADTKKMILTAEHYQPLVELAKGLTND